jgi:hypothetical protein
MKNTEIREKARRGTEGFVFIFLGLCDFSVGINSGINSRHSESAGRKPSAPEFSRHF